MVLCAHILAQKGDTELELELETIKKAPDVAWYNEKLAKRSQHKTSRLDPRDCLQEDHSTGATVMHERFFQIVNFISRARK